MNQWTLLVGSLAVSYSLGAGLPAALPLDGRHAAELLLAAAQSLLGVAVLASLSLGLWEAALLAGLFISRPALGGLLRAGLHQTGAASPEMLWFSTLYLVLAVWQLLCSHQRFWPALRELASARWLRTQQQKAET